MLDEFIEMNREEIIRRCRTKVGKRSDPAPTATEIEHGVPVFLDQLVGTLRQGQISNPEIGKSALLHGRELRRLGFTISQVVHDYGDVCQSITELAVQTGAPIATDDFRALNHCLDDAIASAVTQFSSDQSGTGADGATARGSKRHDVLAHEVRDLLNVAIVAMKVIRTGNVGVRGSTGAILHRNLLAAVELIDGSLTEPTPPGQTKIGH